MMRCLTIIVLPFLLTVVLVGCRSVNTVQRAEPRSLPNIVDSRIDIPDKSLSRALSVLSVRESMKSDLRIIQVEFQNTTSSTKHFKYRVEWFDQQGIIIRSQMSVWTDRTILAKEVISVTAMAPAPGAEDFRLKLLEN